MRTLNQLSFQFTFFAAPKKPGPQDGLPWRVRYLARHYGLPETQARLYAGLLGLPVEAVLGEKV